MDQPRDCGHDCRIEPVGVWTKDEGLDDREGASRYVIMITNGGLDSDIQTVTHDARRQLGANVVSEQLERLNQSFSQAHVMSIHLNFITIGATLLYGWRLDMKLDFVVA
jgi:hypothetical protein